MQAFLKERPQKSRIFVNYFSSTCTVSSTSRTTTNVGNPKRPGSKVFLGRHPARRTRGASILDGCGGFAFAFHHICVSPSGPMTRCSTTTTVFLPAGVQKLPVRSLARYAIAIARSG